MRTLYLTAGEAAVGIKLYLYLRFAEMCGLVKREGYVFDGQAAVEPLLFVIGTYTQQVGLLGCEVGTVVEVIGECRGRQSVVLGHDTGIGVEKRAVGLEMDGAPGAKNPSVKFKEACGGKALVDLFHLRVGECNPYLGYFTRSEEVGDEFDTRAQKCYIRHSIAESFFGTGPHACTLDVYSYEVFVGKASGQSYGVLTLTAAEFKHNGVGVMKKLLVPLAFIWKFFFLKSGEGVLEHEIYLLHLGEFSEFVFAHFVRYKL